VTPSEIALLAAAAAHFGFQLTVTAIVYPALARVAPEQWTPAHDAHSRAITPVVGVVYGTLAATGVWALISGPRLWTWVALAAVAATVLTTSFAARVHHHLGAGHDGELITRLVRIDRIRAVTATLALAAALLQ
jgi:hypothetical protein